MKNATLGGFSTVSGYVNHKIECLRHAEKSFQTIYTLMLREKENIFCEKTVGHKMVEVTYAQMEQRTLQTAVALRKLLCAPAGSLIGLYMDNCEEWIELFWALLMCGYRPLLMNMRLNDALQEDILRQYNVAVVITAQKSFSVPTLLWSEIEAQREDAPFEATWADEIALTTSGTTNHVKLCIYKGQNIYYQLFDTAEIIKTCSIKKHYKGRMKLLTFLPFYHVFGLIAVCIWFGFFTRTFVFLNDYAPETILTTVRRHQVTHIFSVPMLWNRIYRQANKKISDMGMEQKLATGLKIADVLWHIPPLGRAFSFLAFGKVREQIFGNSIRFLISGGSHISRDVLRFFNDIGYHLSNGFGMTEAGITSVEMTDDHRRLISGTVGLPISSVEYRISDSGELLIKGKSVAACIYQDGKLVESTDGYFHTHDLACYKKGRYFLMGRMDDVLIGDDGENLNPDLLENQICIPDTNGHCLTYREKDGKKNPVFLVSVSPYITAETFQRVKSETEEQLRRVKLEQTVRELIFTTDPLIVGDEYKINRLRIAQAVEQGTFTLAKPLSPEDDDTPLSQTVRRLFAEALNKKPEEIGWTDHFFFDLGGESLDYLSLLSALQKEFDLSLSVKDENVPATVKDICRYLGGRL